MRRIISETYRRSEEAAKKHMALRRERARNSWNEWNLSNPWETRWHGRHPGDSWEDDWYTSELRDAYGSPWTGRDDYSHYIYREDGDRKILHDPVGAWQRSCAEDHGVRAQILRRHDMGRAGKFGGKGRLYQRGYRANEGKGAMTFPATVTTRDSQASSQNASTSDVASQLDSLQARMDQHRSRYSLQARMDQLRSRSCSPASAASRHATPGESSQRLTDAEERIRELTATNENLKREKAQAVSERDAICRGQPPRDEDVAPSERCQLALARLLECLSHCEKGEPPMAGAKRRGTWTATLRASCGRFLALMRELTEEAADKREKRKDALPAETDIPSVRRTGNEMFLMHKGRKPMSGWKPQHDALQERRQRNFFDRRLEPVARQPGEKGWHFLQRQRQEEADIALTKRRWQSEVRKAEELQAARGREVMETYRDMASIRSGLMPARAPSWDSKWSGDEPEPLWNPGQQQAYNDEWRKQMARKPGDDGYLFTLELVRQACEKVAWDWRPSHSSSSACTASRASPRGRSRSPSRSRTRDGHVETAGGIHYGVATGIDTELEKRLNPIVLDEPVPVLSNAVVLPGFWTKEVRELGLPHNMLECTSDELQELQALIDGTFIQRQTVDRSILDPLPSKLVVTSAKRSEHPALWHRYGKVRQRATARLSRKPLTAPVLPATASTAPLISSRICRGVNFANARVLFHGSNRASAESILSLGLKIDLSGSNQPGHRGPMYGHGIYLAERASKSDEYSNDGPELNGEYVMLLCRAVLGDVLACTTPWDCAEDVWPKGTYDAVLGDREQVSSTYKEFVFFNEDQIYPEYEIRYRRHYEPIVREIAEGADGRQGRETAEGADGRQGRETAEGADERQGLLSAAVFDGNSHSRVGDPGSSSASGAMRLQRSRGRSPEQVYGQKRDMRPSRSKSASLARRVRFQDGL